jgi:Domain of unknown function (DUF4189)
VRLRLFSMLALFALALAPDAARAEFDNSIPVRNLTAAAPMVVTQTSVFFLNNGKVRVCLSFRNVTAKAASEVDFTFRFDDTLGTPMREAILHRTGSFGPGILIEGKMSDLGGSPDSFNNCVIIEGAQMKPSREIVDETAVAFEDGTTWKKGAPFVAAFTRGGTKLATGQTVGGTSPGAPPPAGATVVVGGATGQGGVIAGSGPAFGTIAWIPGSRTAFGTAVDAPSQDVADYVAMSKCNGLAPGGNGCTVRVRMSGADKKCGAIATDDSRFSTAFGPDVNQTIKAALDALQAQGGTLSANNIVASVCNTR